MIVITNLRITDIEDWEEFMYNLCEGLKHYEDNNPDFRFKITYSKDNVQIKTLKLNESVN